MPAHKTLNEHQLQRSATMFSPSCLLRSPTWEICKQIYHGGGHWTINKIVIVALLFSQMHPFWSLHRWNVDEENQDAAL